MGYRKVNYDKLASTYNHRFETEKESAVFRNLRNIIKQSNSISILEVGCGTGHWLSLIKKENKKINYLVGLDLSKGMLAKAQKNHPDLSLIQGEATYLPFIDQIFDLVYCVNAIHHFDDPSLFIREAANILIPEGTIIIIGSDPREVENSWYVYKYFHGIYKHDLERFPSWREVYKWLTQFGFHAIALETVEIINEKKSGYEVFEDPFLKKHMCSQLAILSNKDYEEGLERICNAIKQAERKSETIIFHSTIHLKAMIAKKQ